MLVKKISICLSYPQQDMPRPGYRKQLGGIADREAGIDPEKQGWPLLHSDASGARSHTS